MDTEEKKKTTASVEHARMLQNEIQQLFAQLRDTNSQIRCDLNEFEQIKESSTTANSTTNSAN
ncbi:XXYS1_4_G0040220.mRNA.1.CDS.1 [Saccharomyces cerevisiae]|nr:EM14S01-3B_G0037670.mRNA.1.CDS.1 [Saccharomyces cerevisiae]CAD6637273.1 XXYS1_4_G0040220.mRNA.1.CDS.1 [Saccharomyces cerevisiae]CAI4677091.1 AMH_1a_G0035970.mRNA.1.CDS.1 [Saccharomyces cerevisiae]CAI4681786.1 CEI_1a_G0035820.mRNA.1.CDS.1 [Saccharomyces cerevisiae]CAI6832177.1 AMH_1a_G0035970.mRNA.1.CDS.1 [Saccharomyces cerevisiae]